MKTNNEILEFLENTTHTQANYQFIVLRELINNKEVEIEDLLIALNKANNKKITWSNTPVFKVLTKKKFIKIRSLHGSAVCNFEVTPSFKINANTEIKRILKIIPQ